MTWATAKSHAGLSVHAEQQRSVLRNLPEEVPVAMVFDGSTQAVMMATPADLEDFAIGFALGEGVIATSEDLDELEIVPHGAGIEARMWLRQDPADALKSRRRKMAGPVGCGLCGIDSIDEALRPMPKVTAEIRLSREEVSGASEALTRLQPLHDQTRAAHAAGFLVPGHGLLLAREDVGRHNALDKLIGALVRAGIAPASGAFVLTSRLSVELVQKAALAGCSVLIAVSAPTATALRLADDCGITLAAFARGGGFDLYSHPHRVICGVSHVA